MWVQAIYKCTQNKGLGMETTTKICLLKGIIDHSLSYWCCYDAAEIHPQMFSIMPNPYKCTMQLHEKHIAHSKMSKWIIEIL